MPRNNIGDFVYSNRENRPGARLTCMRLTNFKSVLSQEINLAPLSVIVGKNSSGKSSLIQSILFLAQNASSPLGFEAYESGVMDLNGELVNLGVFKEVRNDRAKEESPFEIGGRFEFSYQQPMELQFENDSIIGKNVSLDWDIQFKPAALKLDESLVQSSSSKGKVAFEGRVFQEFEASPSEPEMVEALIPNEFDDTARDLPNLSRGLNIFQTAHIESRGKIFPSSDRTGFFSREEYSSLEPSTRLYGIKHVLGLPVNGLRFTNKFDFFITRQEQFFTGSRFRRDVNVLASNLLRRNRTTNQPPRFAHRMPNDSLKSIQEAVDFYILEAKRFSDSPSRWLDLEAYNRTRNPYIPLIDLPLEIKATLKQSWGFIEDPDKVLEEFDWDEEYQLTFPLNKFEKVLPFIDIDKDYLADQIARKATDFWELVSQQIHSGDEESLRNQGNNVLAPASLTDDVARRNSSLSSSEFEFGDAIVELEDFLKRVVYLGPLRLEPSDIYERKQGSRNSQLPLGMQGELLARVLAENPNGKYPLPKSAENARDQRTIPFKDALEAWLFDLGVIQHSIEVKSDRHYGYRVQVDNRYLRSLGVGVSQVIPVIAVCLLAEPGSLIMLEEPELHLNPSIQQKLGDFFLAMTESGRQLLVETHSEYLITRLRLRAMQNPEYVDSFNFIFTHQEHETNNRLSGNSRYSVYREIKPSSTGELPEWPEGFFDQVTTDIQALLEEMIKRQSAIGDPSQDI